MSPFISCSELPQLLKYYAAVVLFLRSQFLFVPSSGGAIYSFTGTSFDGHSVSATAEFLLNASADTIIVKLTNTTALTRDAGELFTGLDFTLGGLTPTMTSDTGIQRTVAGSGAFTDSATAQNLSWSLVSLGAGTFQLNFNPNARDAIIGPPSGGNYSTANGSIKGNPGHNPFAAEMAVFSLSVPSLLDSTPVAVTKYRFGTDLQPAVRTIGQEPGPVPEPWSCMIWLFGIALVIGRRCDR